jgi:glycosyltransferase involved in cell wall biosynthesis
LPSLPLVSVCIPAYNCDIYIEQTLGYITTQTYQNLEIIVINDGSADDTSAQAKKVVDNRIKVIDTINGGASKARNIAYQSAKGAYIIFFDADDYILPNFIEEQVKHIDNRTDIVVLADWGRFYTGDFNTLVPEDNKYNELTFKEWIATYWYNCNPMTNPGRAIIPKNLIEQVGLWNEELSLNDDLDFFTRVFLKAGKIAFNHNAVLHYRSGVNGLSGAKSEKAYQSLYNSILISTQLVLNAYKNDAVIEQSCANMWQSFIYEVYPNYANLIILAQQEMENLPPSNIKFHTGGMTNYMIGLFGWKFTKQLKSFLNLNK